MNIEVVRGDITTQEVDAIVNAANNSLLGGGGVDGAIHRVAGPELLEECRRIGGCPTGEARITRAYRLPSRYVIHTVGPVWSGGSSGEAELLASCYTNTLSLAREHQCRVVAFPAISCGVYGYPLDEAAQVAVRAVTTFFQKNGVDHPETVRWVMFDEAAYAAWVSTLSSGGES
jgi:O-acetyl-ADP-ribose deacetylase (regulator of RNase III)